MSPAKLAPLSSERVYVLLTNYASKTKHRFSKTCTFVPQKSLCFTYELPVENKTWVQQNLLICPAKEFMLYLRAMSQKQNASSTKLAHLSSKRVHVLLTNYELKTKRGFSKTCSFVQRKDLCFASELRN